MDIFPVHYNFTIYGIIFAVCCSLYNLVLRGVSTNGGLTN